MMPEDRNTGVRASGALASSPFVPKTTYRRIKRCFSFRKGIFGQKLEDTVRYEKRYGNHLAPLLVEQCVDFIRMRGLKEEGLFRLPGQANLVKELQDAFDCGEKPLFDRMALPHDDVAVPLPSCCGALHLHSFRKMEKNPFRVCDRAVFPSLLAMWKLWKHIGDASLCCSAMEEARLRCGRRHGAIVFSSAWTEQVQRGALLACSFLDPGLQRDNMKECRRAEMAYASSIQLSCRTSTLCHTYQ